MGKCELYKDQLITIRYNGNIYYGNIKKIYQIFYNKVVEVVCGQSWVPAIIVGEASEKEIYCINDNLYCSGDLILNTFNSNTKVSELKIGDAVKPNNFNSEKMTCYVLGFKEYIGKIDKIGIISDWLFGVEFIDKSNEFYALTNGMIVFNI